MSIRGLDKLVPLIALLILVHAARAELLPEAIPRTVPTIGRWTTWVAAEVEYQQAMDTALVGVEWPWGQRIRGLGALRTLADEDPSAAELWALLMREHPAEQVRNYVADSIINPANQSLRTPAVRCIIWRAMEEFRVSYLDRANLKDALPLFGRDQLKELGDDELFDEVSDIVSLSPKHDLDDQMLELYLLELVDRKMVRAIPLLSLAPLNGTLQRRLMVRAAHNRILGKPDPLSFKVVRDPDDPNLCRIELSVADHEWMTDMSKNIFSGRLHFSFDIYLRTGDKRQLWCQKWPPIESLSRGESIRSAATSALIRQPHKLEVQLRLEDTYFAQQPVSKPKYELPPGPTLLFPTTITVDMAPEKSR